jgi:hypothetical protein
MTEATGNVTFEAAPINKTTSTVMNCLFISRRNIATSLEARRDVAISYYQIFFYDPSWMIVKLQKHRSAAEWRLPLINSERQVFERR